MPCRESAGPRRTSQPAQVSPSTARRSSHVTGPHVIGTEARIAFEVNAGGGVKVPVADTWDMRTDARWFKSFGRDASEHWRVSHGVSFDVGKR